jgi:RNA-directed DNA polymerase
MSFFDRLFRRLLGKTEATPKTSQAPAKTQAAAAPATTPPAASAPGSPAAPTPAPAVPQSTIPEPHSAAEFLPISRAEMAKEAPGITRGGPWFGRRDLIPPADDPRTKLIDRGMLTMGLLGAEELAEIHNVGAEMDRVRPQLEMLQHQAGLSAEEAVAADRAARAERKKQKQAESAERKKQRAEAVARRRAGDIIFVGRGVSERMHNHTSDPGKLAVLGLPVLQTPSELAAALGVSVPRLRWLCVHTEVARRIHYVQFTVPKKSGGTRTLSAPHRALAAAQRWVLENIVAKLPAESAAHGFLPGRSILTNAAAHAGRGVIINLDLEGFFPSITFPRVRALFQRLGYSPAAATLLALLCTECPRKPVTYDGVLYHVATGPRGLPQGACTSPALSNLIARRLDRRLQGLAKKLGLTYTRYADDITFSGPAEFSAKVGYLLARVRHIAAEEGFAVNGKKTRVLRRNTAQVVTGLVVNDKPGAPRDLVRRLRAILHRAKKEGLNAQNRASRPHFRAWLRGMIAYVSMSRPEAGGRLRAALEALESTSGERGA